MPELRKDPIVGRWVIIATERARRPGNVVDQSRNVFSQAPQLCVLQEGDKVILKTDHVRVVSHRAPLLNPDHKLKRSGKGFYDVVSGYGAHEVVIETPDPIANMADLSVEQISHAITAYASRMNDLKKDPNIEYILVYKTYDNRGAVEARQSYAQILASPVLPLHIKEKLTGAKWYYKFHERCIYSDIAKQEEETKKRVVIDNEHFLVIMPFASRFPFETWVIPKKQHCDFAEGVAGNEKHLAATLKDLLTRIKVGLDDPAYTFVINSAPVHSDGGSAWKTIRDDFCWHIEVTPQLTRVAGFEKGSGFYICPIPPEDTAEFLRTAETQ